MTSVGETLRRERVRRNLDLDRISKELKISSRLLEAIEADRFDKLPGGVFARSFVRQYARLVGLDEDEIAGELQRVLDPQPVEPVRASAIPQPEIPLPRVKSWDAVGDGGSRWSSSLPALALVVVVMLVCSAVYAWLTRPRSRPVAPPQVAALPVKPLPSPPARAESPQPSPAPSAPASPSAPPPNETGAERQAGADGRNPNAAVPNPAVAPNAAVASNAPVRVQLTAEEPVWVSAQSDGKYSFSGTLEAAQSRIVEANSSVVLRLGNAGGLNISLNGKPIGQVGPRGQVRTVQLTSGGFQIVPPAPAPPKSATSEEGLEPF